MQMEPRPAFAPEATAARAGVLLLYAPAPVFGPPDEPWIERQAANGLRLWAAHFDRVIVMMPHEDGPPPEGWTPLGATDAPRERIEIAPIPSAYRPDRFLRRLPAERRRIRALIARADYLSFAIGGLFGDWGAVACFEARAMGQPFAVWTDRVESEVVRRSAATGPWRARLRARLTSRPMAWLERATIRRAHVGLFHGMEALEAYAPYCARPRLVHDVHLAPADHISPAELEAKRAACAAGPLRIAYAGRAEDAKGALDWIATLERLHAAGVDFEAVWLGDGARRPEMDARVAALGMAGRVRLPGFVTDRGAVLRELRAAQVFLFCQKTPDSPRCLIEALISGTPLVGYDGAFARDLVSAWGGGRFAPIGDVDRLAREVATLARDRALLAALIRRAAEDGAPFSDVAVFAHRAEIIKRTLPPPSR
jgi:glycosyltransferase involved in cell wall biosynthesis